VAALALSLLGAANGIFWPGFNAMIGAVVPSGIRQRWPVPSSWRLPPGLSSPG
jgi:hypothetical protein